MGSKNKLGNDRAACGSIVSERRGKAQLLKVSLACQLSAAEWKVFTGSGLLREKHKGK